MKKFHADVLLVVILLLVGGLIAGFAFLYGQQGTMVEVRVDGIVQARYPLQENRDTVIHGTDGENHLIVENGQAYLKDADCPDKLCVRQGAISRRGQSIICLPHKVVIEITDDVGTDTQESVDIIVK